MSENDDQTSGTTPPPTPPPAPPGHQTAEQPYGVPYGAQPPAGGYAGQPGQRPQDRFFDGIRRSGLRRSQRRIIGGVSGGIAERTGVDITVVRVLTVVLTIFGGLGLLAYGLAWLLLPEPDGRIHAEQVLRGSLSAGAVGGIVTTVVGFGGLGGSWGGPFGWHGGGFFGWFWGLSGTALCVGLIALVIYAIGQGRGRPSGPGGSGGPGTPGTAGPPSAGPSGAPYSAPYTAPFAAPTPPPSSAPAGPAYPPQPTHPTQPLPPYGGGTATMTAPAPLPAYIPAPVRQRRPSFGGFGALAVAGLAAIGAGITALVMSNGTYDASTSVVAWAVALAVVSAAIVVGGLVGRRAGILSLFAVIATIGTLLAMVPANLSHMEGAGDRTWRPSTAAATTDGYGVGAGDGTLDLSGIDRTTLTSADPLEVSASVGFGRLTVRVPSDVTVKVRASAGAGDLVAVNSITLSDQLDRGVFLGDDNDHGDVNGIGVHRTSVIGSGPVQIVVNAKVGFGEVRIEQVP
jgi:phage shock protein PspC (stress-responsive transcriptional regulator)